MHCSTAYHDPITVLDVFRAATANCKPFVCPWAKLDKAKVSGHGRSQQQINFVRCVRIIYLSFSLSSNVAFREAGRV